MGIQELIADAEAEKFLDHLFEDIVQPQLDEGVLIAVCNVVSAAHTDDTLDSPVFNNLWHNENFHTLISTNE